MTTINWERLPGDTVEEYVEALILTTVNPRACRFTPSRGDKGVDILAPVENGLYDVYQVKRYTRPFAKSSNEEKSIVESWTRFVAEFLPTYPIRRWNLVMPWNPTPERHSWMLNELTAGASIERDWLGRGPLDTWSANNPALADYFFGNGLSHMMELLASAINGAREIPEVSGTPVLDAVLAREKELARQLDAVDPFYRYEVAVRSGRLTESAIDQLSTVDRHAALVTFRELEGDCYQQISIYPKCRESYRLRPISMTVSVDPTADEQALQAAHEMLAYGAEPDRPIPVNVVRSEGPPGAEASNGPALLYVMNVDQSVRPNLELRIGDRHLEFANVRTTRGFNGVQVSGDAQGGVFKVFITFHDGGRSREITVETTPIGGKLPHVVVPGLEFLRDWTAGSAASLAIPYGKELLSFGELPNAEVFHAQAVDWLKIAEHLIKLQSVASQQLVMPTTLTGAEAEGIFDAVRLLDREIIESDWTGTQFQLGNQLALNGCLESGPIFQFLSFLPFSVKYGGSTYQLEGVVAHWGLAQLADPAAANAVSVGDDVAIVPGPNAKLYRQRGLSGPPGLEAESQ